MPAAKVTCRLYVAANDEWSFHIRRGSRIILTAGETYKLRGGARRAVRNLAAITSSFGCVANQLQDACLHELDREQATWNVRKRPSYQPGQS